MYTIEIYETNSQGLRNARRNITINLTNFTSIAQELSDLAADAEHSNDFNRLHDLQTKERKSGYTLSSDYDEHNQLKPEFQHLVDPS